MKRTLDSLSFSKLVDLLKKLSELNAEINNSKLNEDFYNTKMYFLTSFPSSQSTDMESYLKFTKFKD